MKQEKPSEFMKYSGMEFSGKGLTIPMMEKIFDKLDKEFIHKSKLQEIKRELKDNMLAEFYGDIDLANKEYDKLLERINKRIEKVIPDESI